MSGRVTLRISLQPSSCWKSSRVGSCAWSMVPIAPSATTTRVARAPHAGRRRGSVLVGGRTASATRPWSAPVVATAVGFAPSVAEGAPGQGSRRSGTRVPRRATGQHAATAMPAPGVIVAQTPVPLSGSVGRPLTAVGIDRYRSALSNRGQADRRQVAADGTDHPVARARRGDAAAAGGRRTAAGPLRHRLLAGPGQGHRPRPPAHPPAGGLRRAGRRLRAATSWARSCCGWATAIWTCTSCGPAPWCGRTTWPAPAARASTWACCTSRAC